MILRWVAGVGLLLTLVGWLAAPERTCAAVLMAALWVLGIGLGGLAFVAFTYVTRAGWSTALRRVPEAMAATVPLGAVLMAVALAGAPVLYDWIHEVDHDPLLAKKAAWLNVGFFFLRSVLYLAVWIYFARAIRRVSMLQDVTGGVGATARNLRLSTLFVVCFIITFSLACFDWIMSIEAHWFSTVFAVYCFSGMFLAGLAAITLVSILLKRRGVFAKVLREDHLHDLGRLMIGFSTFWAYIWFCQYMLIWYSNMPEETSYYVTRMSGSWGPLMVANVVVNWLVPFLVLLPRPTKRNEGIMFWVAILFLVGRAFDLYLLVQPGLLDSPAFGVWELAPFAATVPMLVIAFHRAFAQANPIPQKDPMLSESLGYHT
ncbi:MAG: hypothetical protein ACYTGZ_11820 [Planctomycetota bacterium]